MKELLDQRAKTHGPFAEQWEACQDLKYMMREHGLCDAPAVPREALENIASKLSRILVGDVMTIEHWEDIAGYATRTVEWIKSQDLSPISNEEFSEMVREAAAKAEDGFFVKDDYEAHPL